MRKTLLLLVGTAVLWVPAVSVAGDTPKGSSETKMSHATSIESGPASKCQGANAFGKCVSTIAKHKSENDGKERADKAESDGKDSASSEDKNSAGEHGKSSANPAMVCKAMRANELDQFHARYGTRPNAFGKCVSGHADGTKG